MISLLREKGIRFFLPAVVMVIAALCILLANSRADLAAAQNDNRILHSDNILQGQVIAAQAFNFNRFNQAAEYTSKLNSLIDAETDNVTIEYREILHHEKTCDLPVPADIADGLLNYAERLRASTLHADAANADPAGDRTAAANTLSYCQAILWIKPLLAAIDKANGQLTAIRQLEQERK
ncbi:hypothetical protein [Mixta intestinalis]|uniref:Uncharacterized protein n=1 Tax=Mixta intestinalis TaxID=1615494 RepID=A0A6P1PZV8_9GAMM|nr:hypothetical protein [Mixta intestinalis]QHM71554.1 hypothetical protein C7M51_01845 [Mixta intestinalis]